MASSSATASYRYFGSNMSAPFHLLSNFSQCEIRATVFVEADSEEEENKGGKQGSHEGREGVGRSDDCTRVLLEREYVFPSSEHFWCAHFMRRHKDVSRLACEGDLSTLSSGLRAILGDETGRQKAQYWGKKDNVGIVAKMLAAKDSRGVRYRAKAMGIDMSVHPLKQYGPQGTMDTLVAIWTRIVHEKFTQNTAHRRALMSTGRDDVLVEFVRSKPESSLWGGLVRGGVKHSAAKGGHISGGVLVGGNFMGKRIMAVRRELL